MEGGDNFQTKETLPRLLRAIGGSSESKKGSSGRVLPSQGQGGAAMTAWNPGGNAKMKYEYKVLNESNPRTLESSSTSLGARDGD